MIVGQYLEIGKVFLKNYKVKKVDIKNLPKLHSSTSKYLSNKL